MKDVLKQRHKSVELYYFSLFQTNLFLSDGNFTQLFSTLNLE